MSDLLKRRRCGTAWTGSGDVAHTCVRGKGHKGGCRSDSGAMKPNWGKFVKSIADGDELVLVRKSDLTGKGDSVILKSDAPIETLSKDEAQYLMGGVAKARPCGTRVRSRGHFSEMKCSRPAGHTGEHKPGIVARMGHQVRRARRAWNRGPQSD